MEFQRNFLIVGLVVVTYFLFLAWQDDYVNNTAGLSSLPSSSSKTTDEVITTPAHLEATTPAAGDLSGLKPASNRNAPDIPESRADGVTGNRIAVRTDVLDLRIDLTGGDIVDLNLPRYPFSSKEKDRPVQLMSTGDTTYIAQSGLVSDIGPDRSDGTRAAYTTDSTNYSLAEGAESLDIVLRLPARDGVAMEKVFHFRRGDYLIGVSYRVTNGGTTPWAGFMFGQLKRDGSGDPANPGGGNFLTTSPSGLGPVYSSPEAAYNKITLPDVEESPLKQTMQGGWIGFIQHYFVSAWIPPQDLQNDFSTLRTAEGLYLFRFTLPQVTVAPGTNKEIRASFYAGPKDQDRLKEISPGLDLTADYGWFWFIAQPLLWILVQIEALVGNWGVAIILLTVLVKLAFYYPSKISYESMAHMRRVTPELTRIREEFKNDRQKQSQEMLSLYRREKINPLGGCLPILLQMPVFIALYWVLLESVELRQAPFFLWITDLSTKDPYFILPILMGISMFIQTKLNPAPPDPMQAKMLQWMPWIFTVFFLFFASGLVLYWLVNNVLSIAQQWYITRKIERQHAKA